MFFSKCTKRNSTWKYPLVVVLVLVSQVLIPLPVNSAEVVLPPRDSGGSTAGTTIRIDNLDALIDYDPSRLHMSRTERDDAARADAQRLWQQVQSMPAGSEKDKAIEGFRTLYNDGEPLPGETGYDDGQRPWWFNLPETIRRGAEGPGFLENLVGGILGRVVAIIGVVLGLLLGLISLFVKIVFNMIVLTLMKVLEFNNFTGLPQIDKVWKAMRDLSNMFFIVILLVIAFGTMLRIEKYNYKQLLPKLLIMALLINFSRTIAGFIIDVSQVVMLTFYASMKEAGAGNFQNMFAVSADIFKFGLSSIYEIAGTDYEGPMLVVVAMIMSFMYLVTGTSVMFTILGMLVFRVVALWILVMLSPIAFFLSTFPQGEEYSGMWWKQFSANVLIGPALAFFLWIALLVNETTDYSGDKAKGGPGGEFFKDPASWKHSANFSDVVQGLNSGSESLANTFAGSFDILKFLNVLLSLTILSVGMMVAQQIGSAGGKMVGDAASKINDWGMKAWTAPTQFIGGGAGNWLDRNIAAQSMKGGKWQYLAMFSPTALKKGYEGYMEEEKKQKFTDASGMVQDVFDKRMNAGLGTGRIGGLIPLSAIASVLKGVGLEGAGKYVEKTAKTEFLSGHTGLQRTINNEQMIDHEGSNITKSQIDEPEMAVHAKEAEGSGNFYRTQAYGRVLGEQNQGDGFNAVSNEQFDEALIEPDLDTDRHFSNARKRTYAIQKKKRLNRVRQRAEQMAKDPDEFKKTKLSEDDLRNHPEGQEFKDRLSKAETPAEKAKVIKEYSAKWGGEGAKITKDPKDQISNDNIKKLMDAITQVFKDERTQIVSALSNTKIETGATKSTFAATDYKDKNLSEWIKSNKEQVGESNLALDRLINSLRAKGGDTTFRVDGIDADIDLANDSHTQGDTFRGMKRHQIEDLFNQLVDRLQD